MDSTSGAALRERRFRLVLALTVGTIGWVGLALLGASLLGQRPPHAGFDLDLLLRAGGRVAAGLTPYDLTATAGSLQAEDLFYSYPPPVAQAMAPFGGLPLGLALALWATGATVGFAAVTRSLVRGASPQRSGLLVTLAVLAVLPFVYPYAVAVLFGNLDLWLPLAYGLVALAVMTGSGDARRVGRGTTVAAGIALGLVTVAKLHPAVLMLWCLVRGWRDRQGGRGSVPWAWQVLLMACGTGLVVVAWSLALGGVAVWADYVQMLRTGSGARLASPLNIGPGSQLALLLGDPRAAPALAAAVSILGMVVTVGVAWARADPVESLAWATLASLVVLPVTWFHYPVALLPFAVVVWVRADVAGRAQASRLLLGAALVVAVLAIVTPVAVWVAVGLMMAALTRAASTDEPNHSAWYGRPASGPDRSG